MSSQARQLGLNPQSLAYKSTRASLTLPPHLEARRDAPFVDFPFAMSISYQPSTKKRLPDTNAGQPPRQLTARRRLLRRGAPFAFQAPEARAGLQRYPAVGGIRTSLAPAPLPSEVGCNCAGTDDHETDGSTQPPINMEPDRGSVPLKGAWSSFGMENALFFRWGGPNYCWITGAGGEGGEGEGALNKAFLRA